MPEEPNRSVRLPASTSRCRYSTSFFSLQTTQLAHMSPMGWYLFPCSKSDCTWLSPSISSHCRLWSSSAEALHWLQQASSAYSSACTPIAWVNDCPCLQWVRQENKVSCNGYCTIDNNFGIFGWKNYRRGNLKIISSVSKWNDGEYWKFCIICLQNHFFVTVKSLVKFGNFSKWLIKFLIAFFQLDFCCPRENHWNASYRLIYLVNCPSNKFRVVVEFHFW